MKVQRVFVGFFLLLGLCLCIAGVFLSFANAQAEPLLLRTSKEAATCVETFMDGVCTGTYSQVQSVLYGEPALGMDTQAETEVGQALQELYRHSLSYQFSQAFYATDAGIAADISVTSLDLDALMDSLAVNLESSGASVQQWCSAIAAVPEEELPLLERTITLNLVHDQTGWWILPEPMALGVISGIPE